MSMHSDSESNGLGPVNELEQTFISGAPEITFADTDERFGDLRGITSWLSEHDHRASVLEKRHSDTEDVYVCAFGLYALALNDPAALDDLRRHPVTSLRMRELSASKISHLAMMVVTQAVSEHDRKQCSDHANILELARKEGVALTNFRSWLTTTSLRKAIKEMRQDRKSKKVAGDERAATLKRPKKMRHVTILCKPNEFPFLDIALNQDPEALSRGDLAEIFSNALQQAEDILREAFMRAAKEAEVQSSD